MIGETAHTALILGEQIDYQVEVERQDTVTFGAERHSPVEEGSRVWLKRVPDGYSIWPSDWLT